MNKAERDTLLADIAETHRLIDKNKRQEARNLLDRLLKLPLDTAELYASVGNLCVRLDEDAIAIEYLAQAVDRDPDNIPVITQLASVFMATGQYSQAHKFLRAALAKNPDDFRAINAMARLYSIGNDYKTAREWGQKAVAINPVDAYAHLNLSLALSHLDELDQALEHAETARRLAPKNIQAYLAVSNILISLGRKDEAAKQIEKVIKIDPLCGPAYERLSSFRKWQADDLPFIEKTEAKLQQDMSIEYRAFFHFALGKMYDDIGQYDKAFDHFRKANTYGKPSVKKDFDHALMKKQRALCTRQYLASLAPEGTSDIPVFIVGMPRSGTSLIEQLIASHPQAAGAGELAEISKITNKLFDQDNYRHGLLRSHLPDTATLHALADEYLAVLRHNRESALRITDKMPENFHLLGMIALFFPRARIIHAARHPLDTALSCYFQNINRVFWSYEMEWIAEAYTRYRNTMDYWEKTLPPGRMITVQYEKLVEDPETEARNIIAHIGLEWDPACLAFFNTQREVKTASVWQVRQPIYQTSKQRWVHYAPHLGELANALADYLQEDDRETLKQHGIVLGKSGWLR